MTPRPDRPIFATAVCAVVQLYEMTSINALFPSHCLGIVWSLQPKRCTALTQAILLNVYIQDPNKIEVLHRFKLSKKYRRKIKYGMCCHGGWYDIRISSIVLCFERNTVYPIAILTVLGDTRPFSINDVTFIFKVGWRTRHWRYAFPFVMKSAIH